MASPSFFAKVFTRTGSTFKTMLDAGLLLSRPKIIREVGKPAGEVTLDLALPWDNFGYGTTILEGYLVKIYAVNDDHPLSTLVYQGHITEIDAELSGGQNRVRLRLFPIDQLLNSAFWKSGATESLADFTVAYTTTDIDTMFAAAITDANTVHGASFFSSSNANPALSITVSFVELTHLEGLQKAATFLDEDWFWRIDADGTVVLDDYPTTATHQFVIDRHIAEISVAKSILDTVNGLRLEYAGPTYALYTDATSEGAYNKKRIKITESDISGSGSANAFGNATIARRKDPKTKIMLTVNREYDLETIQVGETCRLVNLSTGASAMLSDNMRIVRVEYDGLTANLHLAEVTSNFGQEFGKAITA